MSFGPIFNSIAVHAINRKLRGGQISAGMFWAVIFAAGPRGVGIMLALLISGIVAIGPYIAALFGAVVLLFAALWLLEASYKLLLIVNKKVSESEAYKTWRNKLENNKAIIFWDNLHIAAKVAIVLIFPWILVFAPMLFVILLMLSPVIIPSLFVYWICTYNRRKYA